MIGAAYAAFPLPAIGRQVDRATKYTWTCLRTDFGFASRDSAMGFEFNGRVWISNGYQPGNVIVRDLLASADGINWQAVNTSTPYLGYAAICRHGSWIYVYDGTMRRTQNGTTFEILTTTGNPAFEPEAPMVELNGKLHIINSGFIATFDPDAGVFVSNPHPSLAIKGQGRVLFNGRIFILGGAKSGANIPAESSTGYPGMTSLNEVWSTENPEDCSSWTLHEGTPWLQRMWPGVVSHAGCLYVCGGYNNFAGENLNDTWRSPDGNVWEKVICTADYPARHAPAMFSRNGKLLMVTGNTNVSPSVQKDVWELRPA